MASSSEVDGCCSASASPMPTIDRHDSEVAVGEDIRHPVQAICARPESPVLRLPQCRHLLLSP